MGCERKGLFHDYTGWLRLGGNVKSYAAVEEEEEIVMLAYGVSTQGTNPANPPLT